MASCVFENIALNLVSEVLYKCIEIGYNVCTDPHNAFRENERIKTRLSAQMAIWKSIKTNFENPFVRLQISDADLETYHQIMTTLHELLQKFVKERCQNTEERTRILAATDLTVAMNETHHSKLLAHLTDDEKKDGVKLWNRFTAEVGWVWMGGRIETRMAKIEKWGDILDRFSSHVLPMIIPYDENSSLRNKAMPQTEFVAQVRLSRLSRVSSTMQLDIPLSKHDQTSFIIDTSKVITPVRFERSRGDDLKWELSQRSDLGGSGRRQWVTFLNSDGSSSRAILEFKALPSPAEPKLYPNPESVYTWNITEENAKVIRTLRLASQHTETFRVLYCEGAYTQPDHFGFIYQVPEMLPFSHQCQSLGNILLDRDYRTELARNLENRLHLAKALAWTVLELHQVELVHESIHPDNILVFGARHSNGSIDFQWASPYLVGFDCSRGDQGHSGKLRNNPGFWTWRIYTHPLRQQHQYNRFQKVYDIYSLGVVLLELGMMSSFMEGPELEKFESWKGDPNLFKEYFIKMALQLESMWGPGYKEAVLTCLNGQFGDPENVYALGREFKTKVCEKLDQIKLS
jgi:hypothetical protein